MIFDYFFRFRVFLIRCFLTILRRKSPLFLFRFFHPFDRAVGEQKLY